MPDTNQSPGTRESSGECVGRICPYTEDECDLKDCNGRGDYVDGYCLEGHLAEFAEAEMTGYHDEQEKDED